MPDTHLDRWIRRYSARLRLGDFLHRAAEVGAAFLFAFGAIVLVVKLLIPAAWPHILWCAAGAIPALACAWWLARRQPRNHWESVARLDVALHTGGLLMTLAERPDVDWSNRLPQLDQAWKEAIPRLRPRRFAGFLALPLLFAVGTCFVPLREGLSSSVLRNTVGQQAAQQLEALLEKINDEKVLDEAEKEQLQEEIQKLAEESRQNPLTHEKWETVDALRERMKVRLELAAMTTSQAREMAAKLAKAGLDDGLELSPDRIEQLEKDLGETLQKLLQKGTFANAPRELQDALERLRKNDRVQIPQDDDEREELLEDLREFLDREEEKLSELRKKCSNCQSGDRDGEDGNGECNSGSCRNGGNRPGRGGVTRGRGDADMAWGDESDLQGTKFKEVVLPKQSSDEPKDEIVAVKKNAPNEEAAAAAPRGAERSVDPAAGEATWNRKLSPRHRNSVRKYFDTTTRSKSGG